MGDEMKMRGHRISSASLSRAWRVQEEATEIFIAKVVAEIRREQAKQVLADMPTPVDPKSWN